MYTRTVTMDDKKAVNARVMRTFELTGQRGFTLVETLIALVLSSIIFVSSYQVISNLIQYQVRARAQNSGDLDKLLLTNLLSQIIEKSVNQYDLLYQIQKASLFEGDADSVQLISRAYSDHYDKPGYRVYRLYHRDGELFIAYRAYDKEYLSDEPFQLATGLKIENLSFEYFEEDHWVGEWNDDRSIPEFIRIKVDLPGPGSTEWIRRTSRR
jgi:prepilin-type N-terminal cleavage/methylation domain-containing protein